MRLRNCSVIATLWTCCILSRGFAAEPQPLARAEMGKLVKPACVLVETPAGTGSGFCIDAAGLFITNEHVVRDTGLGQPVNVVLDAALPTQKVVKTKVIRKDKDLDLALLQADTRQNLPTLVLGSDEGLTELEELVAFGFPFGTALAGSGKYPAISANVTNVSALRRDSKGKLERIQVDSSLNPGNSGGPVVDRFGKVKGVVVAGIRGAGINLALPVSHVARFMTCPVIVFVPPEVTAANQYDPVEFSATVSLAPGLTTPVELELVLTSPGSTERRSPMRLADGVYSTKLTPFPKPTGGAPVRLQVQFEDSSLNALTTDKEFRVGTKSCKLTEAQTIHPGAKGDVALNNGQKLEGPVSGLDSISLKFAAQTVPLKLDTATEIKVSTPEVPAITCCLIARQAGKEVGRREVVLGDSGTPASEVADSGSVAGGAKSNSDNIKVAAAGGVGLEGILEDHFVRPKGSPRPMTYLKVLSTSGDYIGQGKRYEYTKEQIVIKAAEGLVSVEVDGWHLQFAPGQGKLLKVGEYPNARRYPFNNTMPGLDFSGNGRGSNTLAGKFVVWEFRMQGTEVKQLAVDFMQRSEGNGPPLAGMLRFNSSCE